MQLPIRKLFNGVFVKGGCKKVVDHRQNVEYNISKVSRKEIGNYLNLTNLVA